MSGFGATISKNNISIMDEPIPRTVITNIYNLDKKRRISECVDLSGKRLFDDKQLKMQFANCTYFPITTLRKYILLLDRIPLPTDIDVYCPDCDGYCIDDERKINTREDGIFRRFIHKSPYTYNNFVDFSKFALDSLDVLDHYRCKTCKGKGYIDWLQAARI